jgi:DNA-binding CsgD family transcriptional regulator
MFDHVEHPIFVTDEEGRIEYLNRSATVALNVDADGARGRHCFEVVGLCLPGGNPLCRARCAVQRMACEGGLPDSITVLVPAAEGPPVEARLRVYPVSPAHAGRVAIVHLLRLDRPHALEEVASSPPRRQTDLIASLSPRERDVLRDLASGKTTEEIAQDLFISPTTVRNHVRHILSKLDAHHRIEAVRAWLSATP